MLLDASPLYLGSVSAIKSTVFTNILGIIILDIVIGNSLGISLGISLSSINSLAGLRYVYNRKPPVELTTDGLKAIHFLFRNILYDPAGMLLGTICSILFIADAN